jgi:hypothetical protein
MPLGELRRLVELSIRGTPAGWGPSGEKNTATQRLLAGQTTRQETFDILWHYVAQGAAQGLWARFTPGDQGPAGIAAIALALAWEIAPSSITPAQRKARLISRARQTIMGMRCSELDYKWMSQEPPLAARTYGSMYVWAGGTEQLCNAKKAEWTRALDALLARSDLTPAQLEVLVIGFITAVAHYKAMHTDYARKEPSDFDLWAMFGALLAAVAAVAATIATAGAAAVAAGVVVGVTAAAASAASTAAAGIAATATAAGLAVDQIT